jgi:hypothetical protein
MIDVWFRRLQLVSAGAYSRLGTSHLNNCCCYVAIGASAVRWGLAGNIVWAWVLTIPASGLVAAMDCWISLQIFWLWLFAKNWSHLPLGTRSNAES